MVKANRRISLGIMGWADLLFALSIPRVKGARSGGLFMSLRRRARRNQERQRGKMTRFRWSRSAYRDGQPLHQFDRRRLRPPGTIPMSPAAPGRRPAFALAFEHRVKSGRASACSPSQAVRAPGQGPRLSLRGADGGSGSSGIAHGDLGVRKTRAPCSRQLTRSTTRGVKRPGSLQSIRTTACQTINHPRRRRRTWRGHTSSWGSGISGSR